ncbi:MAG: gliding motility-associated C-terminal domain-containing protein, partial [Nitrosopumilus sp.]|nr:gliding motility-associated C-terminal domain-containing protein [Nitrosopumilus sp.]
YSLILSRQGLNDTTYVDNNNGAGLVPGAEYCYMIVAYYPDGAESYASLEVCTELIKDVPVITNVSVVKTDQANGEIYVAWSKPTEFDSTAYPGPYQYVVYRSIGFAASDLIPVATVNDINDTTFVDTSINTLDNAWSYKIEFFGLPNASLGFSQAASSAFLTLTPTDNTIILNWEEHVPWTNNFDANSQYVIYRKDPVATQFDSIGVSNTNSYIDTGLNNGDSFCYYIKTVGKYFAPDYIDPIENLSQQACAIPIDNIPPCSPVFTVSPGCVSNSNFITWTIPVRECENDVLEFNLYHTSHPDQPFQLIYSTTSLLDSVFNHNNLYSIAGCYMVTSIDSGGNESLNNLVICVENCPVYNIPNIFSPDGDGVNDILHPCDLTTTDDMQVLCPPYQYIQDIHIQIFNRWGNLVYETTDLQINWDGTHQDTGKPCSPGVYYYVCTVNEIYLMGVKPRVINGFVTLARNFDK